MLDAAFGRGMTAGGLAWFILEVAEPAPTE